jgi:hypothetical protein
MICISSKNVAPTAAHPTHHVYSFHIDLASDHPFVFEESIGGGHAEQGGAIALALDQLETWPGNWRDHLQLAGAGHAIAQIEHAQRTKSVATLSVQELIMLKNP